MSAAIGAKQLKLAGSWLSGAAKLAGYSWVADAIDVALRSTDVAEALRSGQDDAVKQALRQMWADTEAGTKAALAAEFGNHGVRGGDQAVPQLELTCRLRGDPPTEKDVRNAIERATVGA